MGIYPLKIGTDRVQGVRSHDRELFYINTAETNNPAIVGSVAGFQYKFPPLQRLAPIVGLRTYGREQLVLTRVSAQKAGSVTVLVPLTLNLAQWMVTLREPDGKYIVKDAPLTMFNATGSGGRRVPLYFRPGTLPDPRQSYIVTTTNGLRDLIPLEFIYAP